MFSDIELAIILITFVTAMSCACAHDRRVQEKFKEQMEEYKKKHEEECQKLEQEYRAFYEKRMAQERKKLKELYGVSDPEDIKQETANIIQKLLEL